MTCISSQALVSIIIPVYKVESYIEQCARSLFEQSYSQLEYIFVDDCSPDNSIEILKQIIDDYPQRKPSVKIIHNSVNCGLAYTRVRGFNLASGEYLTSCDGDDWFEKKMCEDLVNKAEREQSDIVLSNIISHNGQRVLGVMSCWLRDLNSLIDDTLLGDVCACVPSCLFRRSLLKNEIIYPQYSMAEDLVLSIQLIYFAKKISYVEKAYYYYRYNDKSISRSNMLDSIISNSLGYEKNVKLVIDFLKRKKLYDKHNNSVVYLKHRVKSYLWPYVYDRRAFVIWKKIFPEMIIEVWANRRIRSRTKLMYLLTISGVYSLYLKLKN